MDLAQRADRAHEWLLTQAWPLWASAGVDTARAGFHESLLASDLSCPAKFRRLRVLTRQIYVFSRASQYGFSAGEPLVRQGLRRLREAKGSDGLYPWRFDLDHAAIEQTRDLYDHAFVLLAFATAAPVVGNDQVQGEALELIQRIATEFRHRQGGFVESLPPALPRRQNPHMHLLEASLAAYTAFGAPAAKALAIELAELFFRWLLQPGHGVLAEFFDDALAPLRPVVVEPGHHYEWVWLLDNLANQVEGGEKLRAAAARLYDFARLKGICPQRRVARDQVDETGAVVADTARLWPQTERLKAELRYGTPASIAEADDVLHRYLSASRPGLWAERMDASGRFSAEPAPASSLYHITSALIELIDTAAKHESL
jgi:mannose-6-phosphate isomerase